MSFTIKFQLKLTIVEVYLKVRKPFVFSCCLGLGEMGLGDSKLEIVQELKKQIGQK